jgi:uncharacterized damage-inducible protein DinB
MTDLPDLRYPTGRLTYENDLTPARRQELIARIADTPRALRAAVKGFTDEQFDTPYRPGGWTVRQVVHHLPDSHVNAYIRFKLALTEDNPTIKPYNEAAWANVADTRLTPVEVSLTLLDAVHQRWVILLKSLRDQDFARPLQHPENGAMTLDKLLQMYAWHGGHHVAHVTELRKREGWRFDG